MNKHWSPPPPAAVPAKTKFRIQNTQNTASSAQTPLSKTAKTFKFVNERAADLFPGANLVHSQRRSHHYHAASVNRPDTLSESLQKALNMERNATLLFEHDRRTAQCSGNRIRYNIVDIEERGSGRVVCLNDTGLHIVVVGNDHHLVTNGKRLDVWDGVKVGGWLLASRWNIASD